MDVRRLITGSLLASTLLATAVAPAAAETRAARPVKQARTHRVLPPLSFLPKDALTKALRRGEITSATYALERVKALFDSAEVSARYGHVVRSSKLEPTLLMRDLALRLEQLSPSERRSARRILARPDDRSPDPFGADYRSAPSKNRCSTKVRLCFHWATKGRHAPRRKDIKPDNGVPDWVDTTRRQFERVWRGEVGRLGYRGPKSDLKSRNHGPNGKIDIYLADIGDDQIYGYCTSDDPKVSDLETSRYPYSDVSAYCVVDNDYAHSQFPYNSPLVNLQVTAAHEFFHAIQFGYDFFEDGWLLEGSAVAMEDEIYDRANDNYQYLVASPLTRPEVPIDRSSNNFATQSFLNRYGAFVFWRFLTEYFTSSGDRDPKIIREVWRHADGSRHEKFGNQYSLQAAVAVSKRHGTTFRQLFSDFGVNNFIAEDFYEEGAAYQYAARNQCFQQFSGCSTSAGGRPPFVQTFELDVDNSTTDRQTRDIDHLSTNYIRFTPGDGVTATATLRLKLNIPSPSMGAGAVALVFDSTGVTTYPVPLNPKGNETMLVPFGTASKVVLVLTNGNTKMACGQQSRTVSISCQGVPRFDNAPFTYTGTLMDP